ncbi:MAG: SoxR reducing system RseC family protein [Melioribacter sp.]|nr:SoxR reducing system RseC family protein [Melioribacter sp.]
MEEILIEEGIVVCRENGIAEVEVFPAQSCEECSAKIFCKPDKDDRNVLRVNNSIGANVGDNVRIEIKGKSVLAASFNLYGIPLIILLIGIFLGTSIFSEYKLVELYSAFFGIGLTAIYYLFFLSHNKNRQNQILPKIVFIKRNS